MPMFAIYYVPLVIMTSTFFRCVVLVWGCGVFNYKLSFQLKMSQVLFFFCLLSKLIKLLIEDFVYLMKRTNCLWSP